MNIYSALGDPTILPSANSGNVSKTPEEIARENAQKEKVDFLNLLLTQLQNQNPLDPLDTKDFTAQLTRYSILEQGIETNEKLSVTNDLLKSTATSGTFSYIGKNVEVETNTATVHNGKAEWSYLVEGDASDVTLTVTDANGNRLGEVDGSIEKGVQSAVIDAASFGLVDGQKLFLSIRATDSNDAKLNTRTTATLRVDGVWSDGNQNYLTAGEVSFRTSDILRLVEPNDEQPQEPETQPTT
jgi:flagellar basal-body rod modification protein FlgD